MISVVFACICIEVVGDGPLGVGNFLACYGRWWLPMLEKVINILDVGNLRPLSSLTYRIMWLIEKGWLYLIYLWLIPSIDRIDCLVWFCCWFPGLAGTNFYFRVFIFEFFPKNSRSSASRWRLLPINKGGGKRTPQQGTAGNNDLPAYHCWFYTYIHSPPDATLRLEQRYIVGC